MTALAAFDLDGDIVELVPCPGSAAPLAEVGWRKNAWLPEETAVLRGLFAADVPVETIAAALQRTRGAIVCRLQELGLRRSTRQPWTEWDDQELARRYGEDPAAAIALDLGRSASSVYGRGLMLGLSQGRAPAWTPWEDEQLRAGYARGVPLTQLGALIGRTAFGVNSRAFYLGLRHANAREGWTEAELARALELAESGTLYAKIREQLAAEGFPARSKSGFGIQLRANFYGRGWGRRWTPDEDDLLRAAYASAASLRRLGASLGRPPGSLRYRSEELGLRGTHPRRDGWRGRVWTAQEEARLREAYGKVPAQALAAELGRTWEAIRVRAAHLGIMHGWMRAFTADEDRALLVAFERGISMVMLARALKRDPSVVMKRLRRVHGVRFSDRPKARPRRGARDLTLADILELDTRGPMAGVHSPGRRMGCDSPTPLQSSPSGAVQ